MYNDLMYEHDSIALNEKHLELRERIAAISNKWLQDEATLQELEQAQNELHYFFYVMDVFLEHYAGSSLPLDDAYQVIEEYKFSQIEKWLIKIGYDLKGDFENL